MLYKHLQDEIVVMAVKDVNYNIDYIKQFIWDNEGVVVEESLTYGCYPPTIQYMVLCGNELKVFDLNDYIVKSKIGPFNVLSEAEFKKHYGPHMHGINKL